MVTRKKDANYNMIKKLGRDKVIYEFAVNKTN